MEAWEIRNGCFICHALLYECPNCAIPNITDGMMFCICLQTEMVAWEELKLLSLMQICLSILANHFSKCVSILLVNISYSYWYSLPSDIFLLQMYLFNSNFTIDTCFQMAPPENWETLFLSWRNKQPAVVRKWVIKYQQKEKGYCHPCIHCTKTTRTINFL